MDELACKTSQRFMWHGIRMFGRVKGAEGLTSLGQLGCWEPCRCVAGLLNEEAYE